MAFWSDITQPILQRYPALTYPLYRRFWFASAASVGAWQISALAMGWLVFDLSGSTLDLGILGAATAIPAIVLTLVGGVIADRFDKRLVLLVTTAINCSLLLLLTALAFSGVISVWQIWAIAAGVSFVSGIDWPTRQSFFPHLIEREGLLSAVALNSVLWQATRMVLPAFGGVLITWFDVSLTFLLAAIGYLVMWVVLWRMPLKLPGTKGESPLKQTLQGLRYIGGHSFFRDLIVLSYATMLFLSAYMQVMPAFADLFGAGPAGFGVLMSATGVGSLLGTAIAGSLNSTHRYGLLMLGAGFSAMCMLLLFAGSALIPNYYIGLFFAMLAASATSVFLIMSTTALQAEVR